MEEKVLMREAEVQTEEEEKAQRSSVMAEAIKFDPNRATISLDQI